MTGYDGHSGTAHAAASGGTTRTAPLAGRAGNEAQA